MTISIENQNALGNNQQIISHEWYDYTDSENPILLSTDSTYTVPDSMIRRFLKLKVVIKDLVTDLETIYYPFQQYISDNYEIETVFFTNGSTGNSISRIITAPTTNTTKIGVRAVVRRTNTEADKKLTSNDFAIVYLAQYNADGTLKRVVSHNPGHLSLNPNATRTGNPNMDNLEFEEGDYFKSFVWLDGSLRPLSMDSSTQPLFLVNDTRNSLN